MDIVSLYKKLTEGAAIDFFNSGSPLSPLSEHRKNILSEYIGTTIFTRRVEPKILEDNYFLFDDNKLRLYYEWYFNRYIFNSYPNQSKAVKELQKLNYLPLNTSFYQRAISDINGAMFQDANHSIEIPKDLGEDATKVLNDAISDIKKNKVTRIIEDPNGYSIVCFFPKYFSGGKIETEAKILNINCYNVVHASNESIIFVYDKVTYYIDTQKLVFFVKIGDNLVTNYESPIFHNLGYLPAFINGGILTKGYNGNEYYTSYISKANAIAIKYAKANIQKAAIDRLMIPMPVKAETQCPTCAGRGSLDIEENGVFTTKKCSNTKCENGYIITHNLGDGYTYNIDDLKNLTTQPLQYIAPPSSPQEYATKDVDREEKALENALYLQKTYLSISGEAKEVDLEPKRQFHTAFAENLFSTIAKELNTLVKLLGDVKQTVTVKKPTVFEVVNETDLYNTLAVTDNAFARKEILDKLLSSTDILTVAKLKFLKRYDKLFSYSDSKKLEFLALGLFSSDEINKSMTAIQDIDNLIDIYGSDWFMKSEYKTILDALQNDINNG